jgi:hypothetical protein
MTAVKKTLLQIVQDILSDMDSEPVNSLSDTLEAEQIATIVEHTFYDMVTMRLVPEHEGLIKLTPASDSLFPTHMRYPDNVTKIERVWYDKSTDLNTQATREYREIYWKDPMDFIRILDRNSGKANVVTVNDKSAATALYVKSDKHPDYYTSFDDEWIVFDSYLSTSDDTLQASKVRAYGKTYPVFDRHDGASIPDLDGELFQYLIHESKSRAFDALKGGSTPKVEQSARRAKVYVQNDKYRTERANRWSTYGRHS